MSESLHIWMSHVTYMSESFQIRMSHVTYMSESLHIWMSESFDIWMSHATYESVVWHMNKTCHVSVSHFIYEYVSRLSYEWVTPRMSELFHTWTSDVTYSRLQIGWHRISRLFLLFFQQTRILPMGFTISTNQVIHDKSHENPGTKLKVFRNNPKILCQPICNWLYERFMSRVSHWTSSLSAATIQPQHTATHCNTLQHTATHYNTPQHTATHCNTLQHTATHCNTLQHTATPRSYRSTTHQLGSCIVPRMNESCHAYEWVIDTNIIIERCNNTATTHCNTLQHAATQCNTLQHTASHCNTLQHTMDTNYYHWAPQQ